MKRKILIGLVIFCILYTSAWFFAANVAEDKINDKISSLQEEGVIKSYSGNINITGFPFKFTLELEYPNIHFTPKSHNASYNLLYDGNVNISVGLFSNSVKMKTDGNMHLKGYINDYRFHIISSGDSSNTRVKLYDFLLSPKLITNIIKTSNSLDGIFFGIIKSIHFDAKNLKIINQLNNEILFNIGSTTSTLKTKYNGKYNIFYREKTSNTVIGEELYTLWDNMITIPKIKKLSSEIPYNLRNYFDIFRFHNLGLIQYDAEIKLVTEDKYGTEIHIDKFLIKDDIENIVLEGDISVLSNKVKLDLSSSMNFTEKWYELMKQYISSADLSHFNYGIFERTNKRSIVSTIALPINSFVSTVMRRNGPKVKESYVPKLHQMGDIILDADIKYHRKQDNDFELEIDNIKLNTKEYGFQVNGRLENTDSKDSYNFILDIRNYPNMVDITAQYLNRIAKASRYNFLISGKELTITNNTSTHIKNLIRLLSADPESAVIDARIQAKKQKDSAFPEVGNHNPKAFKKIWNNFKARLALNKVVNTVHRYLNNKVVNNKATRGALGGIRSTVNGLLGGLLTRDVQDTEKLVSENAE